METKLVTVWEALAAETQPVVLYGMGDGADKILRVFAEKGITAAGVFASDEFVRGHSFAGFPVLRLRDAVERFGEGMVVVLCFGSQRPELLARFYELDKRFCLYAPDVPVCGGELFDREFAQAHRSELEQAYALMGDEQSRRVFEKITAYKLTGKISFLRDCETPKEEIFEVLQPSPEEHFTDLGAYNGDTIRELLEVTGGRYGTVTAFEPDRRNFRKLERYAAQSLGEGATLIPAGAWSQDGERCFAAKAGRNSAVSGEGERVLVRSVDSVLSGKPCTFLKLDVEGAETEALIGASETIGRWHPKLNCACYHRSEDLFALPLLVAKRWPGYRLYLRHHPYVPAWDTNLYAVWEGWQAL